MKTKKSGVIRKRTKLTIIMLGAKGNFRKNVKEGIQKSQKEVKVRSNEIVKPMTIEY